MSDLMGLVRRLVSVENDQLPYDYEQGLCAWCQKGTDAAHPERYMPMNPKKFVATPHAEDCPYAEARKILARLKPHEFIISGQHGCEECGWPYSSAVHLSSPS